MSTRHVVRPEKTFGQLSPGERKTLYYLTDRAKESGKSQIQVYAMDIAMATGMQIRNVRYCVGTLERFGYLKVERVATRHGNEANRYTILNPEQGRRSKIEQASAISEIPVHLIIDYVDNIVIRQHMLKKRDILTTGDIAYVARAPGSDAKRLTEGLVAAGIIDPATGEIRF